MRLDGNRRVSRGNDTVIDNVTRRAAKMVGCRAEDAGGLLNDVGMAGFVKSERDLGQQEADQ